MKIVFEKSLVFVLLVSLYLTLKPATNLIGCNTNATVVVSMVSHAFQRVKRYQTDCEFKHQLLKLKKSETRSEPLIRLLTGPRQIQMACDLGVSLDLQGKDNRTLLSSSLRNDDPLKAQYLIDMGANVNAADFMGRTPYYWALKENNQEHLDFLRKNGADTGIITENGHNIFFEMLDICYIQEPDLKLVSEWNFLLDQGVDPNSVNNRGETLLSFSIKYQNFESAKLLLEYKADPMQQSRDMIPMQMASESRKSYNSGIAYKVWRSGGR